MQKVVIEVYGCNFLNRIVLYILEILTWSPQEFMLATDMTASGSPEEKLRWAFKMYDKDASGEE